MTYDVMLEREDRIQTLGWADTKEEAEQMLINYVTNTEMLGENMDFRIWIEEDKDEVSIRLTNR